MADPLSLAASLAGLCTLAEVVVRTTRQFVKAVRGSEKEIAKLISSTAQLYGILEQLRLLEDGIEEEYSTFRMVRAADLFSCETTLHKLETLLRRSDPRTASGFLNTTKKKLEWPFKDKEIADLQKEIESHKATLSLALNANEMNAILSCLQKTTEIASTVLQEQAENQAFRMVHRQSVYSRRREKILDFMTSVDPHSDQSKYIQMRQDMTGLWFTEGEEFKSWMSTKNGALWLAGIPGAGKTILFSSVIEKVQQSLNDKAVMAYFYCDYRDAAKQDALTITRSLIRQFAHRNDRCFEKLEEFYETHGADEKLSTLTQNDLKYLLHEITGEVKDALIIIDALDECLENTSTVVRLLRDLNIPGSNIKTLFSSRDEGDIRIHLADYKIVSMADNTSDIARYVEFELKVKDWAKELDPKEKEVIKDALIRPAGGMFRWVACQIDALAKCKTIASRRKTLKTLPRDLSETYLRILERIDRMGVEDNKVLVQRVLRWTTWAKSGISLPELQEAVAVNPGDTALIEDTIAKGSDILDLCSSLVRCNPTTGIVELAHATVKEFLTTIPTSSDYYSYRVDESSDNVELAVTCLTYLCFEDFSVDPDDEDADFDDYQFLNHSARCWDHYAEKSLDTPILTELQKKMFAPTKSQQFINWTKRRIPVNHDLPDLDAFFAESTPFHWAAMLGLFSTCKWLIDQGCSVSRATETLGGPLRCAVLGESVLCDLEQVSEARGADSWHKENRARTIATILEAFAAIERLDYRYEDTVLLKYALKIGEPEHVKLLLQNGSIVDRNCLEFLEEECESETLPAEMQEILQAMSNDNFDSEDLPRATKLLHKFEETSTHAAKLLKTALQLHPKKLNGNTEDQNQTLRSVSRYGQYDLVAELLRRPDIEVDSKNPENGCTALHLACEAGHLEVVKLLVERGANINALNNLLESPAFLAAEWGHVPVLTFLHHNGADLALAAAAEERDGRVLSHQAAIFNHVQVIRYLMKTEPALVQKNTRTVQGKTVLMCAALEGSIKTVEYILDACPDDEVVAESNDGCCALHFAAMSGKKKLVELLIRKTANLNIKSKDGSNALHFAALASEDYAPNANVVTALMEAGVDHLVRDEKGNFPGHLAARIGTWDSFSTLKRLIQASGDKCPWINEKSDEAKTLLQIITTHRNFTEYSYDMISLVCSDPGIDLECLDSNSRTPLLHLASRFSQDQANDADSSSSQSEHSDPSSLMDTFEALVTRGANIHHTDNEGESALRLLGRNRPSTYGFYAMECLLKQGASVITPNKYGKTVLDIFFAKIDEKSITVKLSRSFFEAFCQVLDRVPGEYFERYQYQGWQPLNVAFRFGAADIILKLIDRGADVDKPDTKAPCLAPIQHMCLARVYDEALVDKVLDRSKDINRRDTHGDSLLVLACKQGHLVVIRSLLRHGVNLVTNDNGIHALSAASFNGHNQIVELLIESGIDVNSRTGRLRVTPLMSAVEGGNLATVQSLLRKGADVNLKTTNDWNVAHFLAVRGNESYLEELLSTKLKWDLPARATMPSESPETTLSGNNTPLHLAALHEFTSMIRFLFKHNLVPEIDIRNSLGATPLWVATAAGKLTAVKELLSHGADINAASLGGATPVPIAVAFNMPTSVPANPPDFELLVTTLLDTGKFNFGVIDNRGRSVFHIAALFGSQQSLLALLSAVESTESKDLINSLDNFQATPLKRAIERGDPDIISILTKAGAIVDLLSKEESLALDTAASILLEALRRGDEALLYHAIKEGADLNMKIPYCTLNKDGERHQCTPLVVALYGHYSDRGRIRPCPTIARFLIDKDVDINVKSCFNGLQPIHLAVAQKLNDCVKSLLSKDAVLADHKISPFHIAVLLGNETLCKLLLEHEMNQQGSKSGLLDSQISAKSWKDAQRLNQFWNDPFLMTSDLKCIFSGTALHIAACLDFPNTIVEWLLEQGADPNSVNQCLQTPLMYALHWGEDEKTIQVLLERPGVNVNQRDVEGLNAVHYAISSQYLSRVETLEDFGFDFQEELNNNKIAKGYLAFAMREGAMEAAEFFIKKGHDPNFRPRPGRLTPLQMATGTTKAEEFLEKYAPEVDIGDDIEGTLLNSACTDSSPRAIELLLSKALSSEANMCEYVNKGCINYGTPLYAAAYRGNIEVMQILLDAGADINKCDGGRLGTPLDAACALERVEAVKFLFSKGAKIKTTKMTGPELCEGVKASGKLKEIRHVLNSGDLSQGGLESG